MSYFQHLDEIERLRIWDGLVGRAAVGKEASLLAIEIEPNTANSYGNDLTNHLLPFFKDHRISEITVADVDRYSQHKVRKAAEITAATESGTPMMMSYVDRRGRSPRQARPL